MPEPFNWHEDNTIMHHLLLRLPEIGDKEKFQELSLATDKFSNVVITMQVNGIEVDARPFFEGLEKSFDWHVGRGVKEKIKEIGFYDLEEMIYDVTKDIGAELRKRLKDKGITLIGDDY